MRSRFSFRRPFCEVCGGEGGSYTQDGWRTCLADFATEKPHSRLFDHVTGEPIDPAGGAAEES